MAHSDPTRVDLLAARREFLFHSLRLRRALDTEAELPVDPLAQFVESADRYMACIDALLTSAGAVSPRELADRMLSHPTRPLAACPDCGVFTSNDEHACVEYDPAHPCPECGAPSVYVYAGAPGYGGSWSCTNNHHWGSTIGELSEEDVR